MQLKTFEFNLLLHKPLRQTYTQITLFLDIFKKEKRVRGHKIQEFTKSDLL